MKTVPLMDERTETLLTNALTAAADLVESGTAPNTAVIKAASQYDLGPGQVATLVRTFNVGSTLQQYRRNEVTEKLATVPLADLHEVMHGCFPDLPATDDTTVKKATDSSRSVETSLEAVLQRRRLQARQELNEQWCKLATAESQPQPATDEQLQQRHQQQAYQRHQAAEREYQRATATLCKLSVEIPGKLDQLADCLQRYPQYPYQEVRENCRLRFGGRAARLVDKAAALSPFLQKHAAANCHRVDWSVPPYSIVAEFVQAADEFADAQQQQQKFASELTAAADALYRQRHDDSMWSIMFRQAQQEKQAEVSVVPAFVGASVGAATKDVIEQLSSDPTDELTQKKLDKLFDPLHETMLRQIRAQAMLRSIADSDPIIGSHDPYQVEDAYNRIAEFAPASSQHRLVVQPLLRKMLEQGEQSDLMDAAQLAEIEKRLLFNSQESRRVFAPTLPQPKRQTAST